MIAADTEAMSVFIAALTEATSALITAERAVSAETASALIVADKAVFAEMALEIAGLDAAVEALNAADTQFDARFDRTLIADVMSVLIAALTEAMSSLITAESAVSM